MKKDQDFFRKKKLSKFFPKKDLKRLFHIFLKKFQKNYRKILLKKNRELNFFPEKYAELFFI
jgi:hypothetical protein